MEKVIGTVKWFNNSKGYGFINVDDGREAFVHFSAIKTVGYKTLSENQSVEFEVENSERGLLAKNVKVI